MERHSFAMEIKKGKKNEYRQILGEIWPDLTAFLDQEKVHNFSIWNCDSLIFGYYETDENGVPFAFPTVNERYKAAKATNFSKIPGSPVAYWVSNAVLECYKNSSIYDYAKPCKGIDTGDNNIFLRFWHEISEVKRFLPKGNPCCAEDFLRLKWFPYNKGGNYRRWYGNNEYVLNWEEYRSVPDNLQKPYILHSLYHR